ncbi:2Fe-2S iron-sulfur cluster-binding protein [Actinomycetospora sp. NBRC 106378]|jgi:ferredoxin, 2Fe-2S|uniref:2Fe-2S iron-sulfur cluster-binding protein n=1 Tax=Actinomycetospora sp. NBRC 106378 TaxID=3032208 RepID=UPI0024A43DF3|nr:2Fe-2S iron-sulfur cluster-binding protein [Actinomycetospora sp. NBRC 106378]GLZ55378.1 ferredoxin [Actinomycetospora sp. NBRC 106378]
MATITYVQPDGRPVTLTVDDGESVMRGAVLNGVDGILAQCGGGASCGTCHVYVADPAPALPPMHAVEDELLYGTAAPRRDTSRLSCQLPVDDRLDGLVVHLPDRQI